MPNRLCRPPARAARLAAGDPPRRAGGSGADAGRAADPAAARVERLVHGRRRPWTGPHVQIVCRLVLACIGLRWRREGTALRGPGAVVANHSSWPGHPDAERRPAGLLRQQGRGRPLARHQHPDPRDRHAFRDTRTRNWPARRRWNSRTHPRRASLLFFPEGTSSDGRRVLPFKPTLFQGFLADDLPAGLAIQPVSAVYHAPPGQDPRFYGWWADMDLGPHLLSILAARRHGHVTVRLHPRFPSQETTARPFRQHAILR